MIRTQRHYGDHDDDDDDDKHDINSDGSAIDDDCYEEYVLVCGDPGNMKNSS